MGCFLPDGLNFGTAALVIATPEHRNVIFQQLDALGSDPAAAASEGRLSFLDAAATMAKVVAGNKPDWYARDYQ